MEASWQSKEQYCTLGNAQFLYLLPTFPWQFFGLKIEIKKTIMSGADFPVPHLLTWIVNPAPFRSPACNSTGATWNSLELSSLQKTSAGTVWLTCIASSVDAVRKLKMKQRHKSTRNNDKIYLHVNSFYRPANYRFNMLLTLSFLLWVFARFYSFVSQLS